MSNRGQERLLGPIKGLLLRWGPSFRAVPPKVPLLVRKHFRQLLMLGFVVFQCIPNTQYKLYWGYAWGVPEDWDKADWLACVDDMLRFYIFDLVSSINVRLCCMSSWQVGHSRFLLYWEAGLNSSAKIASCLCWEAGLSNNAKLALFCCETLGACQTEGGDKQVIIYCARFKGLTGFDETSSYTQAGVQACRLAKPSCF